MPDDTNGTTITPGSRWSDPVEAFASRVRSYPLPRDPAHYIERRNYRQDVAHYEPLDPGTPLGEDPELYLIDQGIAQRDGNLILFWRDYANIPRNGLREPTTFTYEFIGFLSERARITETVNAEVQYDYFLPGVSTGIHKLSDIPIISRQQYTKDGEPTKHVGFLNDGGGTAAVTDPTTTEYIAMVTAGTQIVAQDSEREVYLGPIVQRKTIYIKAQ